MEKKRYMAPDMQVIACEMEQQLLSYSQVNTGSNQARPSTFSFDDAPAASASRSSVWDSEE